MKCTLPPLLEVIRLRELGLVCKDVERSDERLASRTYGLSNAKTYRQREGASNDPSQYGMEYKGFRKP